MNLFGGDTLRIFINNVVFLIISSININISIGDEDEDTDYKRVDEQDFIPTGPSDEEYESMSWLKKMKNNLANSLNWIFKFVIGLFGFLICLFGLIFLYFLIFG